MFALHGLQTRIASHRFGRRRPFTYALPIPESGLQIADDARLFFTTFVGGLLFMTIYLA